MTVVTLLAIVLVLLGYRDAGVTFDEGAQARYGDLALRYYASLGGDERVHSFYNLRYYGPVVEMLAQGVSRVGVPPTPSATDAAGAAPGRGGAASVAGTPGADSLTGTSFERRHLVLGLLAVLVLPALAAFLGIAGSARLVLFATLILATLPRYVGHVLNNSKDVPFALAYVLFVASVSRLFARNDWARGRILAAGGAMGLVIAIRPGGLALVAVFFLAISIVVRRVQGEAAPDPTVGGVPIDRMAVSLRKLSILGVAGAVAFALWPWLQAHPLLGFPQAASHALSFPRPLPVLFHGAYVDSRALPRTYLLQMLAFTTPPAVLALMGVGLVTAAVDVVRRASRRDRAVVAAVTLVWVLAPLVLFLVRRPAAYDGIRHFLFVLPGVAALAAFGADRVADALASRLPARVAVALVALVALLPAWSLVRLHPYGSTYFNALAGGLEAAAREFDTDYWMSSYREAMRWIDTNGSPAVPGVPANRVGGAQDAGGGAPTGIEVLMAGLPIPGPADLADGPACWRDRRPPEAQIVTADFLAAPARHAAAPGVTVWTLPELWAAGRRAEEMDYYLATTRWAYDRCFPEAEIVHRVQRLGATFAVVKRLSGDGATELAGPAGPGEVPDSRNERGAGER